MPTKIKFDPDKHKYFVSGREVPSVTTILKELGILDDRWFKPGPDQVGTKVHEYLDLIDQGFKVNVPLMIRGYIRAYHMFREANPDLEIVEIEKVLFDSTLDICGKPDRVYKDKANDDLLVIDFKTGAAQRFHKLQLTAYAVAYKQTKARIGCLYLSSDGNYKYKEHERVDRLWRSCVMVYDYKVRR